MDHLFYEGCICPLVLFSCWTKYWFVLWKCKDVPYWCRPLEMSTDIYQPWSNPGLLHLHLCFQVYSKDYLIVVVQELGSDWGCYGVNFNGMDHTSSWGLFGYTPIYMGLLPTHVDSCAGKQAVRQSRRCMQRMLSCHDIMQYEHFCICFKVQILITCRQIYYLICQIGFIMYSNNL